MKTMMDIMDKLDYNDLLIISSAINRAILVPEIIIPHKIRTLPYDMVIFALKRDWNPQSQIILERIDHKCKKE